MYTKQRRLIVHHLIRCAILTAFGMYIVLLSRWGALPQYVEPNLVVPVKLSAIGLFATAVYQLNAALQQWQGFSVAACDCNHEPSPSLIKNLLLYALFVLPLALGFIN